MSEFNEALTVLLSLKKTIDKVCYSYYKRFSDITNNTCLANQKAKKSKLSYFDVPLLVLMIVFDVALDKFFEISVNFTFEFAR